MKPIEMLALHLDFHGTADEVIERAIQRMTEDTKALARISGELVGRTALADKLKAAINEINVEAIARDLKPSDVDTIVKRHIGDVLVSDAGDTK